MSIYAICAPPAPDTTNGACLYPATCDATFAGTPVLDVTTAQLDFRMPVQINNALVNNENTADGRINTNDAFIHVLRDDLLRGAALAVERQASPSPCPRRAPRAGSCGSSRSSTSPALAPAGTATTSLVVNVRGHGVLTSQDSFTTAWFQVPVTVCSGCLDVAVCPSGSVLASCPSARARADVARPERQRRLHHRRPLATCRAPP